jgi:lipid-A-disaccharide synthase-like uncharacterized protein
VIEAATALERHSELSVVPRLSVVIPAKNEAESVAAQMAELDTVLAPLSPFEVVYVVDGSTDRSLDELTRADRNWLRVIVHAESCGKSAAILTGVRAARAEVVATLDGDGQNDPRYVLDLVAALEGGGPDVGLAVGQRTRRGDGRFKRQQSRVANRVRKAILNDDTRDTACGHKVFRRDVFLALPFFDSLHRFLPALVNERAGAWCMSTSSTVRASPGPRITASSTASGAASWTCSGSGGSSGGAGGCRRSGTTADDLPALARRTEYLYDVFVAKFDWWVLFGLVAQVIFAMRFVVQWIASERAGRSVMPVAFWFISLGGGLLTLVYGLVRREPIIIIGQVLAVFIYVRNLMLIYRPRRRDGSGMT